MQDAACFLTNIVMQCIVYCCMDQPTVTFARCAKTVITVQMSFLVRLQFEDVQNGFQCHVGLRDLAAIKCCNVRLFNLMH